MQFEVFTLLPDVFPSYLESSILKRAHQKGLLIVNVHNIREYTHDKHNMTDDTPYGGGGGMVMKPEPVFEAVETVLGGTVSRVADGFVPVIMLTPQGRVFTQSVADELSHHKRIALICGRYEGIDERIREHLVTDDALVRLIPGVLGDPEGAADDSHASGLLEYPHYTRPPEFRGWKVPEVLLSGDHGKVAQWRRQQALLRTHSRRPDLLKKSELSENDLDFLAGLKKEEG